MKVLIVEDEFLAAEQLKSMLSELPYPIEVMAVIDSVKKSVEWLKYNKPQLIFMDIHLGDGDSFSIFNEVNVNVPVIFTTAYDEYALSAFKNNGIDFLLKPFDVDDLKRALDKISLFDQLLPQSVLSVKRKISSYQNRFLVGIGNKLHTVSVEDIAYFMADGKYLFLYTLNGNRYVVDDTLSSIISKLDSSLFFKINRKFIISIHSICEMCKFSSSRIKVTLRPLPPNSIDTIVSSDRIIAFKDWLNGIN